MNFHKFPDKPAQSGGGGSSRWLQSAGVFVAIAWAIIQLSTSKSAWWHWALLSGGVLLFGAGVVQPLASSPTTAGTPAVSFRKVQRRWSEFKAKVAMFAEFFEYSLVHCLASSLNSAEGLDLANPEDIALNARREAALNAIGLLNRLSFELMQDLRKGPRTTEDAASLVARFQSIASAPATLGMDETIRTLARRLRSPEGSLRTLERLSGFKRDYETFARVANQELGVEFYRVRIP